MQNLILLLIWSFLFSRFMSLCIYWKYIYCHWIAFLVSKYMQFYPIKRQNKISKPNFSLYGYRLLVGRLILFLNIWVNILLFVTVLLSIKTLLLMNTNKHIDVYETIYCRICCKRSFILSLNNIDDIFWIAPDIVFQLNMFWNFSSLHLNNAPFVIKPN